MSTLENYPRDIQMRPANEEEKNEEIIGAEEWDDRVIELDDIEQGLILICSVDTKDFKSYIIGDEFKNRIKKIQEVMDDDI